MSKDEDDVQIINRINRIKRKITGSNTDIESAGFFDPEQIKEAQSVIDGSQDAYKKQLKNTLEALEKAWEDARYENGIGELDDVHRYANHIKDIATTYGYGLMGWFGESLRDFAEKIDVNNDAHNTIVQAHMDTMWIAANQNIQDENSPQALELKKIVAKAIEKYS